MKSKLTSKKSRRRRITAADVGRYLKHLATLNRDPLTGNPELSEALLEISAVLSAGKALPAPKVLEDHASQTRFEFEREFDFHSLSLEDVRKLLQREDLTKADLTMIGMERFGIAKSRMDRITRDEIVQAISSAMQHEESLAIISEEAQRHSRTS
jgi:hypothetical protein